MSDSTREPPWLCLGCGYMMDACAPIEGTGSPDEGDLTLCLNCGALHVRHGVRWLPITPAEREAIDPEQKADLALYEAARRRVVSIDLTRRDSRA